MLRKLYITNNKLTKIEGLETLENLQVLWLSENQIKKIENIDNLIEL